jgi:hypothetical protein
MKSFLKSTATLLIAIALAAPASATADAREAAFSESQPVANAVDVTPALGEDSDETLEQDSGRDKDAAHSARRGHPSMLEFDGETDDSAGADLITILSATRPGPRRGELPPQAAFGFSEGVFAAHPSRGPPIR